MISVISRCTVRLRFIALQSTIRLTSGWHDFSLLISDHSSSSRNQWWCIAYQIKCNIQSISVIAIPCLMIGTFFYFILTHSTRLFYVFFVMYTVFYQISTNQQERQFTSTIIQAVTLHFGIGLSSCYEDRSKKYHHLISAVQRLVSHIVRVL